LNSVRDLLDYGGLPIDVMDELDKMKNENENNVRSIFSHMKRGATCLEDIRNYQ